MGQDYHIYIHSEVAQTNPTQPSPQVDNKTIPSENKNVSASVLGGAKSLIGQVGAGFAMWEGFIQAVKLPYNILGGRVAPYISALYGDSSFGKSMGDVSKMLSLTTPSGVIQAIGEVSLWNINAVKYDLKQEQRRILTGNGITNNYGGKGV